MKKLTLLSIAILALINSSCKMHVFYVKSNMNKDADTAYVFENDTVRIRYDLWENKGKMHFSIYNKLNVPLFIDWKNSSFIMNDLPVPYWIDKTETRSRGGGVSNRGVSSYNSAGTMVREDRVTMIPPHSKILKDYIGRLCKSDYPTKDDNRKHFRNYIAYSVNEDTQGENFSDCDFEVTEIKVIKNNKMISYKSPSRFYTDK